MAREELQSLELSETKVTDTGLKELAALKELRSLQLYGTLVTNAGLKELHDLKRLQGRFAVEVKEQVGRVDLAVDAVGDRRQRAPAVRIENDPVGRRLLVDDLLAGGQ